MSEQNLPLSQGGAAPSTLPSTPEAESASTAHLRPHHVLLLGLLSMLGPLAKDMYVPALPALSHDLGATTAQTQITLSAFILGFALGQVIVGPISDALGRKRPLVFGVALYTLASLLSVLVPSVELLTVLRLLQGLSASVGAVLGLAMVSDLATGLRRARLFSLLVQILNIAPMVAPVIGGQLLRFGSWHVIFVALTLAGLGLLVASAWGLSESLPVDRRQAGGLRATGRVLRGLLRERRFVGYALSSGFAFTAGIIYISLAPFVLQMSFGLSAQSVSLTFGLNSLGMVLIGLVNTRLVGHVSSERLLLWGYALLVFGGLSLLVGVLSGFGLVGILPAVFVLIASLGLIQPNATTLALADTQAAGSAAAVLGLLQLALGAVVAPLVGLVGTTSPLPMTVGMAVAALVALATLVLLTGPGHSNTQEAEHEQHHAVSSAVKERFLGTGGRAERVSVLPGEGDGEGMPMRNTKAATTASPANDGTEGRSQV
jgi:MFS transporter, DHA1 family, multidrug resistance protein